MTKVELRRENDLSRTAFYIAILFFGILITAVYTTTLSPTIRFWDSAELTAASYSLGVAHPPGFPLYIISGRVSIVLGLADPAFVMNLFSALCSATAVILSIFIYRELNHGLFTLGAILTALLFAFGGMLWMQAVRAEVYSFAMLLLELSFLSALLYSRLGDTRYMLGCGYFWGLGFSLHTAMAASILLPMILVLSIQNRKIRINLSDTAYGFMGGLAGLSVFFYLPIRAVLNPQIKWGVPERFSGFLQMVTASEFSYTIETGEIVDIGSKLGQLFSILNENFPFIIIPFILLGMTCKKRLILILILILSSLTVIMRKELPHTDYSGYLLPAALVLAIFAGRGFDHFRSILLKIKSYRDSALISKTVPVILILFLCLPISAAQYQRKNLSGNYWAEQMGRDILENLPDSSLVLFDDISSYFICQSLQTIDGFRSDCILVQIYALNVNSGSREWYLEQLKAGTDIAGLEDLPGDERAITGRLIESNYRERPIFCEYGEAFRPFCNYLRSYGLVYEIELSENYSRVDEWDYDYPAIEDFGYDRTAALAYAGRIYAKSLYFNDIGDIRLASKFYSIAKEMESSIR